MRTVYLIHSVKNASLIITMEAVEGSFHLKMYKRHSLSMSSFSLYKNPNQRVELTIQPPQNLHISSVNSNSLKRGSSSLKDYETLITPYFQNHDYNRDSFFQESSELLHTTGDSIENPPAPHLRHNNPGPEVSQFKRDIQNYIRQNEELRQEVNTITKEYIELDSELRRTQKELSISRRRENSYFAELTNTVNLAVPLRKPPSLPRERHHSQSFSMIVDNLETAASSMSKPESRNKHLEQLLFSREKPHASLKEQLKAKDSIIHSLQLQIRELIRSNTNPPEKASSIGKPQKVPHMPKQVLPNGRHFAELRVPSPVV